MEFMKKSKSAPAIDVNKEILKSQNFVKDLKEMRKEEEQAIKKLQFSMSNE